MSDLVAAHSASAVGLRALQSSCQLDYNSELSYIWLLFQSVRTIDGLTDIRWLEQSLPNVGTCFLKSISAKAYNLLS
jgi:hypothetical protein